MFCKECGVEVEDDVKFCPNCGASLSTTAEDEKPKANDQKPQPDDEKSIKKVSSPKQKDMGVGIVISLILPGLGVAYAGNKKKGIIIFIVTLLLQLMWGIGLLFWIYGLYATYIEVNCVNGKENQDMIEKIRSLSRPKKIVIFLVILVVLSGIASFTSMVYDGSDNSKKDNSNNDTSIKNSDSTSNSNKNTEMSEADFKSNCTTVDYGLLEKNPSKYMGQKLVYSGKVFQISEDRTGGYLLLAVNDSSSQLIFVSYDGTNNFVEDNHITVYGEGLGDYSYDTKIGGKNTVPWIKAKYME